jgi:hypothetical protein
MLVVGSSAMAGAHFANSSTVGVVAFEHLTSASEFAVEASRIESAASTLAFVAGSSIGVRRTG